MNAREWLIRYQNTHMAALESISLARPRHEEKAAEWMDSADAADVRSPEYAAIVLAVHECMDMVAHFYVSPQQVQRLRSLVETRRRAALDERQVQP